MKNDEIWNYMAKNENEIQCCFCGRIFSCTIKPRKLLRHLTKNHIHDSQPVNGGDSVRDDQQKKINRKDSSPCWKYFTKIPKDSSIVTCNLCQTQITHNPFSSYTMNHHLRRVHSLLGESNTHLCSQCGKQFNKIRNKYRCEARHSSKYQCTFDGCSWKLSTATELKRHISAVHKKLKPHICDQCGRAFSQRTQLRTHSRVHTGETPFGCEKCQKKFKFAATRDSHKCVITS